MKKIILNERTLKHILMEMAKQEILNEAISTEMAYKKFYEGKINPQTYQTLMVGTVNMTPFHKLAVDAVIGSDNPDETASKISQLWNSANQGARAELVKAAKENKLARTSAEFISAAEAILNKGWHTEGEMSEGGFVVIHEDEYLRVTCTLTYAASLKHYRYTKWCTASDIGGEYNGWAMFLKYSGLGSEDRNPGCYIQIVRKENPEKNTIQALCTREDGIAEARDVEDEWVDEYQVDSFIEESYPNEPFQDTSNRFNMDKLFNNEYGLKKLIDMTKECSSKEYDYWAVRTRKLHNEKQQIIRDTFWSQEKINAVLEAVADEYAYDAFYPGASSSGLYAVASCAGDGEYAIVNIQPDDTQVDDNMRNNLSWLWSCKFIKEFAEQAKENKLFLTRKFKVVKELNSEIFRADTCYVLTNVLVAYDNKNNSYVHLISGLDGSYMGKVPYYNTTVGDHYVVYYLPKPAKVNSVLVDIKYAKIINDQIKSYEQDGYFTLSDGNRYSLEDLVNGNNGAL